MTLATQEDAAEEVAPAEAPAPATPEDATSEITVSMGPARESEKEA